MAIKINGDNSVATPGFTGDDTDTGLQVGTNELNLVTGGSARVKVDSSGKVGIGTTTPGSYVGGGDNFVVAGSGDAGLTIATGTSNTGTINFADGTSGDARYRGRIEYSHTNDALDILTGASTRMRIDSSGRLLVGTTTEGYADYADNLTIADSGNCGITIRSGTSDVGSIYFSDATSGAAEYDGFVNYNQSSRFMQFGTAQTERMRIKSDGTLHVIKSGTQITNAEQTVAVFQRSSATGSTSRISIISGNAASSQIQFGDTDDEDIGIIHYDHADNSMRFSTNTSERMRINQHGFVKAGVGGFNNLSSKEHEFRSETDNIVIWGQSTSSTYNVNGIYGGVVFARTTRDSNSAFALFNGKAGNDTEFNLRGDGNGYCDGSWSGGGADYAEYFEWSDGNLSAEDRRGISVALDGDKIRQAVDGEEPIGVISGNPSVIGDNDIYRWKNKYLRDDFGTYIQEDYEVEDEEGNTVTQQRRKLNPDYNEDQEYVPREDRPEWDCVGLMGKIRIRKGQVIGSRWIKMRDISDSVEEWLVR